jgi:hypothetical protein
MLPIWRQRFDPTGQAFENVMVFRTLISAAFGPALAKTRVGHSARAAKAVIPIPEWKVLKP